MNTKPLNNRGWDLMQLPDEDILNDLRQLYERHHDIDADGMFYSLYSADIEYRRRVHEGVIEVLSPLLEDQFPSYRPIFGIFIVKTPDPDRTEFFVHQDPSYVDERMFKGLHLWIPLQDVSTKNGPVRVLEGSHRLAGRHRGITVPSIFQEDQTWVREHMHTVPVRAGEALLLDPRTVHDSAPNQSNQHRVVVLVGLISKEAPVEMVYVDEERPDLAEIYRFPDRHFLTGTDFFMDCRCRPETGTLIRTESLDNPVRSREDAARLLGIDPVSPDRRDTSHSCQMFGEPRKNSKETIAS